MATDLLTTAAVGATTIEADAMPHRLLYLPIAPIFAVFGAALTGVCTLIGSATQQSHALFAVTAESPVATGWWGGLVTAVAMAGLSVYQGWRQKKRAEDTEDRAAWRAELMQADEDRVELRAEVKRLNGQIAEMLRNIEHVNANVKHGNHLGKAVAEKIAEQVQGSVDHLTATAESTNRKVARVAEALSGSGIDITTTDPDMPVLPVTPVPPRPKAKPKA